MNLLCMSTKDWQARLHRTSHQDTGRALDCVNLNVSGLALSVKNSPAVLEHVRVCVWDADEAEGRLVQLVQHEWVGGSTAARSQFARAGMAVLTQLWEAQGPTVHMRLHSHLDATILEEVATHSLSKQRKHCKGLYPEAAGGFALHLIRMCRNLLFALLYSRPVL